MDNTSKPIWSVLDVDDVDVDVGGWGVGKVGGGGMGARSNRSSRRWG